MGVDLLMVINTLMSDDYNVTSCVSFTCSLSLVSMFKVYIHISRECTDSRYRNNLVRKHKLAILLGTEYAHHIQELKVYHYTFISGVIQILQTK